MDADVQNALLTDRLIDIVTTGARSGLPRRTEIWFTNIDGRIFLCGTPAGDGSAGPRRPRDWVANLRRTPAFLFCLKESVSAELPAQATVIDDVELRTEVYTAAETLWYRDNSTSLDALIRHGPLARVRFLEPDHPS